MKHARLILGCAAFALALDLWSKWLVMSRFALGESLPLLPGLALTYVRNPGAAFSLFAGWSAAARLPIFFTVTAGALWALWHYAKSLQDSDLVSAVGLGLIAGGALGNFIDRVRFHEVVDFIEVGVREIYTWPIFNAADSAVCVGVALLFYRTFRPLPESHAPDPL